MQVDPIKPKLIPPRTNRLKLRCDILLSTSAFKFNLRRYSKDEAARGKNHGGHVIKVGCCKFKLVLQAPGFGFSAWNDNMINCYFVLLALIRILLSISTCART